MSSSFLFNVATLAYLVSMVIFFVFLGSRNKTIGLSGSVAAYVGFLVQTAAIGLRWKESYDLGHGHAPLSNLYESVVFFAWTIILIFALIDYKYKHRAIGAFVVPFAFLGMAWAQLGLNSGIEPLVPALQSNWLLYHVVTCFLGYAAFAVACGVSIMYLIKSKSEVGNGDAKAGGFMALFPSIRVLDDLNYKAIMLGFPTAFTLMGMGVLFAWLAYRFGNPEIATRQTLDLMVQRTYAVMTNDVLISVPLFVFMGYMVERANLIERLFKSLHLSMSFVPGSLAVATLATCALFATATGIVGAVVTLMGLLAFPAMLKSGYDIKLSAGAITAGGCLGTRARLTSSAPARRARASPAPISVTSSTSRSCWGSAS